MPEAIPGGPWKAIPTAFGSTHGGVIASQAVRIATCPSSNRMRGASNTGDLERTCGGSREGQAFGSATVGRARACSDAVMAMQSAPTAISSPVTAHALWLAPAWREIAPADRGGWPGANGGVQFRVHPDSDGPAATSWHLTRLRQLSPLTDDNLLIFRDRTPKGRHYTERPGDPPTGLQDSSFGAGCFGNAKSS